MPNVTFSKKTLVRSGVVLSELQALVERLGMEIEEEDPSEVTLSITPNRPDMLDATGLCRALKFISGRHVPRAKRYELDGEIALNISVDKSVAALRPFIAGMVVEDVDLSRGSLNDLRVFAEKFCETFGRRRKKVAIGIHDMDKIDGDIKYAASQSGHMRPLGAVKQMDFSEVMEKNEKGIEYGHLLHGEYLSIADKSKVLALIPIINSEDTKVTEGTKRLFIDITGTSQAGVDDAASIIACSFIDQGGKVRQCVVRGEGGSTITPVLNYKEIKVRVSKIQSTIGVEIPSSSVLRLVGRVGYNAARLGISSLFIVPPYRVDIMSARDVIEDVAIAYGYDNIKPTPIPAGTIGAKNPDSAFAGTMARIMVGFGFSEAINMYITTETDCFDKMRTKAEPERTVSLSNSKSGSIMRQSILPSLIKNISISSKERMPYKLFEAGPIFSVESGAPFESESLAFASCHPKADFAEIKSYVMSMLSLFCINEVQLHESRMLSLIPGRQAALGFMGIHIGIFGELHPEVLGNFGIEEPVACAELDLKTLRRAMEIAKSIRATKEINR